MMPLIFADLKKENTILRIGGNPDLKAHLKNLGLIVGGKVTVIAEDNGNLIMSVKNSRIAISKEMASKIIV